LLKRIFFVLHYLSDTMRLKKVNGFFRSYLNNKVGFRNSKLSFAKSRESGARNGEEEESRLKQDEQYILNRFETLPWAFRLYLR